MEVKNYAEQLKQNLICIANAIADVNQDNGENLPIIKPHQMMRFFFVNLFILFVLNDFPINQVRHQNLLDGDQSC